MGKGVAAEDSGGEPISTEHFLWGARGSTEPREVRARRFEEGNENLSIAVDWWAGSRFMLAGAEGRGRGRSSGQNTARNELIE